ncbi:LOW QUALITY PROTEIN: uncharacterized protein LOC110026771 [Phalaenopsis equestris]|uniref:LOW QUALITY PROTEIN: uncharacterized protein LOC110026771 n=1 Tax=Phalaenopsis equestris TaxID=78828 RepID=UPI0009E5D0A8|nr:LOW QUALITY PROTEIN: uncharacterized protein LOC110026771 [Phalaenopsis equestris]
MIHIVQRISRSPWIAGERFSLCHLTVLNIFADKSLLHSSSSSDLTISYLMKSCGLSQSVAFPSLANKINLKTTENADSILALLREHGFATSHIASIITKSPRILFSDAENNIKSKLEFFLGVGVSNDSLAKLISAIPSILKCSLENRLRPNFDILRSICGSDKQLLANTCKFAWLLSRNFEKEVFPNLKTLQDHGVPPSNIVKLSIMIPQVLLRNPARFSKSVISLKEMGFDLSALNFVYGLKAIWMQSNSNWERKFQLFQSLGWSAEETFSAFKKFPVCMMLSDKKIKRGVNFFVEIMNFTPSVLATQPILLCYSLEKRIVPRHNVMNILASKGLAKNFKMTTIFYASEKRFLEKYVFKYKIQAPEVILAYKDKIDVKCLMLNYFYARMLLLLPQGFRLFVKKPITSPIGFSSSIKPTLDQRTASDDLIMTIVSNFSTLIAPNNYSSFTTMLRLLRFKPSHHLHYSTSTRSTTSPTPPPQSPPLVTDPTLTLYFLQKSCNLSPSAAAAASKEINLKSTKRPHSVISLLRNHGFSDDHITALISRLPKLLLACPTRTLKPKLDLYASLGLSNDDFADHIYTRARIFLSSIKNRLAPNLRLLRLLIPSHADLLAAVRRYPAVILSDLQNIVPDKTKPLLDYGLPMDGVLKLIALHPKCLTKCSTKFDSCLAAVKELGINPSSSTFVHAFAVISKVPAPVWKSRVQNFLSLGWSMDQISGAFARHPYCMSSSEEKVRRNLEFFEEKLGWGPAKVSCSPVLLSLSFEKRIVPRYGMLKLLDERGLLRDGMTCRHFLLGEKRFNKNYVDKYQQTVPEILEAISGKLGALSSSGMEET